MSNLIKCLECRLVGAPPVFKMQPPPLPPVEFLKNFNLTDKFLTKQLRQIQLKKCLSIRKYVSNLNTNLNSSNDVENTLQSSLLSSSQLESVFQKLTPNQSFYIFIACLILFLIVLSIAFIFIYKLIRLRNELKKTYAKSSNLLSENGSINSNLIITPSTSSIIDEKSSQFLPYNLMPLYDSASSNSSVSSKNTSTSYLFYNQLFESTKHLIMQNNSNNTSSSSSSSPQSNPPCEYYLQAVPNNSNLIESHLLNCKKIIPRNQIVQQEYDEINSQCYQMDKTQVYNQYDDGQKLQMIVQPIFPMRQFVNNYPQQQQILNTQNLLCIPSANSLMKNSNINCIC
ncbi:unnamed protein product [Brachionus calyciflorus]|uniref:Transmembrane protein n=1 Tax=Brachionus calyciflorus TaxID=104777 RepID=A0A813M232_9BILA|nr:unnamed protein product [Brachionus calyciflorus]